MVHEGNKPFQCFLCPLKVSTKQALGLHIKRLHSKSKTWTINEENFENKTQESSYQSSVTIPEGTLSVLTIKKDENLKLKQKSYLKIDIDFKNCENVEQRPKITEFSPLKNFSDVKNDYS